MNTDDVTVFLWRDMRHLLWVIKKDWQIYGFAALLVASMTIRLVWLSLSGEDVLVKHVPDDAFYYMVVSENFAESGHWTFDGINNASGFHLLYAYMLVFLFKLFGNPGLNTLFVIFGTMNCILLATAFYLLSKLMQRVYGMQGVIGVFIVFSTSVTLIQPTLMMESVLAIYFGSLFLWFACDDTEDGMLIYIKIFVAGLLGELSRSDFGLFPFMFFSVMSLYDSLSRKSIVINARLFIGLLGAVSGLAFLFMHNYIFFGHLIQGSARMKSYWGSMDGYDTGTAVYYFGRLFVNKKVFLILVFAALIRSRRDLLKMLTSGTSSRLFVTGGLTAFLYILMYGRTGSSVQLWYIANFLPAACIIFAMLLANFKSRSALLVMSILALGFGGAGARESMNPVWSYQTATKKAGEYIRKNENLRPVGGWNSGIVGYYAKGGVINLDGLVNDTVHPYIRNMELNRFLLKAGVRHLLDYSAMIEAPGYKVRGGYPCNVLTDTLKVEKTFTYPTAWLDSKLTLYSIDGLTDKKECEIVPGIVYDALDSAIFTGWDKAINGVRKSSVPYPEIQFFLARGSDFSGRIIMALKMQDNITVEASVNGHHALELQRYNDSRAMYMDVAPEILRDDRLNTVRLSFSEPGDRVNSDGVTGGIALEWFMLE